MTQDINELKGILKELFAAYPNANVSPETVIIYSQDLSELNPNFLREAIRGLRKVCHYLPTIAELYEESSRIGQRHFQAQESQKLLAEGSNNWQKQPLPPEMKAQWDHCMAEARSKSRQLDELSKLRRKAEKHKDEVALLEIDQQIANVKLKHAVCIRG